MTCMANPVIYKANKSIAKNKHLVLIASDHEYRGEETLPALARILALHHGFDCTVLFGLNEDGEITGGASHIPGLEALKTADWMIQASCCTTHPIKKTDSICSHQENRFYMLWS